MSNAAKVVRIGDVQTLTVSGYEVGQNVDAIRYFFTDELLEKQILIQETSYYVDDGNKLIQELELYYCSDEEAVVYELYAGEYLNSILVYNIVSAVVELYQKHQTIDEFLAAVRHLSGGYSSATMQSDPTQQLETRELIQSVFEVFNTVKL